MRGLRQSVVMMKCTVQNLEVPESLLGELTDSAPLLDIPPQLRKRLAEEGYLFLRGVLDPREVLAARREALERLVEVGEIRDPAIAGIATGESRRAEVPEGLGPFWKSVSEGPALRQVSHGAKLRSIMQTVFGEPPRPQDYIFLRIAPVGRATQLHYDHPFFARGSLRVHTVWIALGDVPVEEGPLTILEGSNRFTDLIEHARAIDYNSKASPRVAASVDPITLARERETRLLTANFKAGDLIVFGMHTMHGSLDNCSPIGRVRVSCDVRYQPAADAIDERYFGPNPGGTTGAGYAELNGAKPLTQEWHTR